MSKPKTTTVQTSSLRAWSMRAKKCRSTGESTWHLILRKVTYRGRTLPNKEPMGCSMGSRKIRVSLKIWNQASIWPMLTHKRVKSKSCISKLSQVPRTSCWTLRCQRDPKGLNHRSVRNCTTQLSSTTRFKEKMELRNHQFLRTAPTFHATSRATTPRCLPLSSFSTKARSLRRTKSSRAKACSTARCP